METLGKASTSPQGEHERALQLAQARVTPLYERMEANNPRNGNQLKTAIKEHVARAQGRVALDKISKPE